jgi:hypothetical protein
MFYLKGGQLDPSTLTWSPWTVGTTAVGLTANIDTSAANFQSTPAYVAQIVGARTLASPETIIVDWVTVASPSPTGFTLQLAVPAIGPANPDAIRDPSSGLMAQLNWQISWLGVEG